MNHMRGARRLSLLAIPAAVLLAVVGCSSGGSSGSGGSSSGSSGGDSSIVSNTKLTQADLNLALTYTGGKAAKADSSSTPVQLGFINDNGGSTAFPQASNAAKIAAQFINDHADGIGGHPVQIDECDIVQGDADAQKCAQQFLNNPNIVAITTGMTPLGTGPIYTTLDGKKFVYGKEAFSPVDLNQPNVTFLQSGAYTTAPGVLAYAQKYLKAKSIAMVYDGTDAGAEAAAQVISTLTKQYGITVKEVSVTDSSQWGAALISAGASSADAVFVDGGLGVCVPAAQALTSDALTSKPVIAFDFCEDASVAKTLGDYPKWTYLSSTQSPMKGLTSPETSLYNAIQNTYSPTADRAGGAQGVMGTVFALAHVLNNVGYANLSSGSATSAISQAATAFTGPIFMAAPTVKCGQYTQYKASSICSTTVFPANYSGNGKWVDPTNGTGIDTNGVALKIAAGQ